MVKPKTPFFSFGARGTVGNALTVQRRAGGHFARAKPFPKLRHTLPQTYQRWLYEDYAYLWTQQSQAVRDTYRGAGVRFHLTGFQYWMKDMLTRLPDIMAWYKLDTGDTVIAQDSGRNANHATVFGASGADGVIQDCLFFDGINDYLRAPGASSLDISSPLSMELFLRIHDISNDQVICNYSVLLGAVQYGLTWQKTNNLLLYYFDGAGWHWNSVAWTPSQDIWYHLVAQLTGAQVQYFVDGAFLNQVAQVNAPGHLPGALLTIACDQNLTYPAEVYLDNIIIRDRALDSTEILRHAERRFPL